MTLLRETLTDAERAECNAPGRRTITGFSRYSQVIPSTELSKVNELARLIQASHQPGQRPIRRIRLVGHADLDNARGRDFENRISAERARTVERALRERLPKPVADRLRFEIVARGSSRRCVLNPVNETDRMRNRRVEVFTAVGAKPPPPPYCGGLPATAPPVELKVLLVLARTVLESILQPLRIRIKPPTALRFLYRAERAEAEKVFRGSLDYSRILLADGLGMFGRMFTISVSTSQGPFVILLTGDTASCWASTRPGDLIHELTHAWQSQHHRDSTAFMVNSVKCQAAALADIPIAKAAAAKNAVAAAVRRGEFNPEVLKRIGIQAAFGRGHQRLRLLAGSRIRPVRRGADRPTSRGPLPPQRATNAWCAQRDRRQASWKTCREEHNEPRSHEFPSQVHAWRDLPRLILRQAVRKGM